MANTNIYLKDLESYLRVSYLALAALGGLPGPGVIHRKCPGMREALVHLIFCFLSSVADYPARFIFCLDFAGIATHSPVLELSRTYQPPPTDLNSSPAYSISCEKCTRAFFGTVVASGGLRAPRDLVGFASATAETLFAALVRFAFALLLLVCRHIGPASSSLEDSAVSGGGKCLATISGCFLPYILIALRVSSRVAVCFATVRAGPHLSEGATCGSLTGLYQPFPT